MNEADHNLRALILEDSEDDARLEAMALEAQGYALAWERVDTEGTFNAALDRGSPDIILADHSMPQMDSTRALEILNERGTDAPLVLVSGTIGEEAVVSALQHGASDYVSKGSLERLGAAVQRARNEMQLRRDRRSAEDALRASERRYRSLVDAASDFLWWADRTGAVTEVAPGWLEYTGFAAEQALDWDSFAAIHPDDRAGYLAAWREAVRAGSRFAREYRLRRADGGHGWFADRAVPIADESGAVVEWVGASADITQRKEAELALRDSEARYRTLFEQSPNAIFLMEEERVVDCNVRAPGVFGRTREELIGIEWADFSPQRQPNGRRSADLAREHIEAALAGATREFEWQIVRGDGRRATLEVTLSRVDHHLHAIVRDVTERRALEQREREHHSILQGISEGTTDFVFVKDAEGHYLHINSAAAEALGRRPGEILGRTDLDLLDADTAARMMADDLEVLQTGATSTYEEELAVAGRRRVLQTTKGVCVDQRGDVLGVFGISRDVTDEREVAAEMRKLSRAMEQAAEAVMITDADRLIEYVNPAFERITGYGAEEVRGRSPALLRSEQNEPGVRKRLGDAIRAGREFHGILVNRRRSGELYYADMSIAPIRDDAGRITHFVGTQSDATERLRTERELARLAYYDLVTDLPNRTLLVERLDQTLTQARRFGWVVVVVQLDLDSFGLVNETLGHAGGDYVLHTVGQRLQNVIGGDGTAGRIGNDGFTVLVTLTDATDRADRVATEVQAAVSAPIVYQEQEITITATAGVAVGPTDAERAEALMRAAETALHRARGRGREQIAFYAPEMSEQARQALTIESALRRALEQGEFHLEYQPQVDLYTGRISGVEALLRWDHPEQGRVSPAEFMPLLERTGLIVDVGQWVIREACAQVHEWQGELGRDGNGISRVAVNLSLVQFERRDLVEVVREALEVTGTDARFLELELTETSLARHPDEAARTLAALRELGVSVALDDFGVGYSSLNYLKRFPIDTVKIDRVFVEGVTRDAGDAAILRAVLELARSRRMKTIAEGVETEEQVRFLRAEGCRHVQGFHFSRSVSAHELQRMLTSGEPFAVALDAGERLPGILLCSRSGPTRSAVRSALEPEGYRTVDASDPETALEALAVDAHIGVVLADASCEDDAVDLLGRVRTLYPNVRRALIMPSAGNTEMKHAINSGSVNRVLSLPVDAAEMRREAASMFREYEARRSMNDAPR